MKVQQSVRRLDSECPVVMMAVVGVSTPSVRDQSGAADQSTEVSVNKWPTAGTSSTPAADSPLLESSRPSHNGSYGLFTSRRGSLA